MIEKGRKHWLPALRYMRKKKLLEETAKVDKLLSKFRTHRLMNCSMQELLLLKID